MTRVWLAERVSLATQPVRLARNRSSFAFTSRTLGWSSGSASFHISTNRSKCTMAFSPSPFAS